VTRVQKRKIGLLEGNEIGMAGQPAFMGGRGTPPWTVYRYLERDFEIVNVPFDVQPMKGPDDKDHPFYDLDLLLIVHPVRVNRPQSPQPGMPPMGMMPQMPGGATAPGGMPNPQGIMDPKQYEQFYQQWTDMMSKMAPQQPAGEGSTTQ